jgi:hypothetical protein
MPAIHTLAALLAAGLFLVAVAARCLRPADPVPWRLPALASLLFLAFSVHAISAEGFFGFWPEHVRNAWGNQIWFDLLLAASVGFAALVPRARRVGMSPWPWALALVASGSVGLLAMFARILYLEDRA